MTALNRKLLRDLWRIRGQAVAIGAVIAVGVLMLVMTRGLVTSLDETRRAYYERYRLADVFAQATRAPEHLLAAMATIPGVSAVQGRVAGSALIDLPGLAVPVQARAVSLPDIGEPRLNAVYLVEGRSLDRDRGDEILLLKGFARAHNIAVGDRLSATMNGAQRTFRVAGLAQSPEFLYTTAPGELAPDDSRFGVLWMTRTALAAAYDMDGAFNEVLLALGRGTQVQAVFGAVDHLLDPYGGTGAYGLADHPSDRFVSEEIDGLRGMSRNVPPVFLGVAAFILYIVISRMVHAEREEIGLMKAFGYRDVEVGAHYLKLVLAIATGGALVGCLLGIGAGRALIGVYLDYFKFPFLVFILDAPAFVSGFIVSVCAASLGGIVVLRRVFALMPAEAMRPPTPVDYSGSGHFGQRLIGWLDQPSRMVVRRLLRQPGKMLGAVLGIAAGIAISVAMLSILGGFDKSLDLTFNVIDRSDVTVSFTQPMSMKTTLELRRMQGVLEVEPVRVVPAILRHGLYRYRSAINGLIRAPRLNRAVDKRVATIAMREEGVVLATALADILHISAGDSLLVEVREGRQPVLELPVVAIADTLMGAPAFMQLEALNAALREPDRVSGAFLRVDALQAERIYRRLKDMPYVAGVSLKADARDALQRMMDEGSGLMRYVMAAIAGVITFGVIYNAARIAQAERARDLASLQVLGFSRSEVAFVLLGEIVAVVLLALPIGSLLGYGLSFAIAEGFSSDLYQVPVSFSPQSHGMAGLAVLAATLISGWQVMRAVERTDLVAALKIRE